MYGPQTKSLTSYKKGGWRSAYRASTSYRTGNKLRFKPLPYDMIDCRSTPVTESDYIFDFGDAPNTLIASLLWHGGGYPLTEQAYNSALDKFVESFKGGTDASLAVTLAEWRQSEKMIVTRSAQLIRALRNLRKLHLGEVAKDLGLTKERVNRTFSRKGAKDVAGQWLELHFGWVPLIQDIHNAVNVLQGPIPGCKARGSSSVSDSFQDVRGNGQWSTWVNAHGSILIGADVHLENPNLALANRMGLINPATVAWELVPFSFLVDWFIPVGNFLNSFTDFVGYRVENPFTTTLCTGSSKQVLTDGRYQYWSLGEMARMKRDLGIPARKLTVNTFKGLSLSRGATAISLVLQQFLPLSNKSR